MKWLTFLLLLWPSLAFGQVETVAFDPPQKPGVVVGGNYSPADVAKAREVLAASEAKELKLKLGEFEVIEPSKTAKEPLQFQYLTNKCYFLFRVKPGMAYGFAGIRRGDTEERQHEFEPKPYEWAIVKARAQGAETLVVNRNGKDAAKDPPEEIDRISIVVGEKKPDDPNPPRPDDPPVDDPLTKALRAAAQSDAMAGKADKKYILPLAGIFEAAGNDSLQGLATMADLDARLNAARVAAGIPDPAVMFPQLRAAIRDEIYKQLGIDTNGGATPLKPDTIRLAKATFTKIAASLEVLAK